MGRPKKKKAADLECYVYRYDSNHNKIESFNIFRHYSFCEYVDKACKKYKTREEFMEQVRKELSYYFRWKCEHELIVKIEDDRVFLLPWCGCRNPEEVKINVSSDEDTWKSLVWKSFAEHHINKQVYGNKAKIDIYDQVMWSWEEFIEYVCKELGVG